MPWWGGDERTWGQGRREAAALQSFVLLPGAERLLKYK